MLATPSQLNPGATLLLTDGAVLVQGVGTSDWWKLTPDNHGDYTLGTLTQVASFPMKMAYDPWGFASAVLPDGRVIVEGGEYNFGTKDWTTKGAIYNPVANRWTLVHPPGFPSHPWAQIGDVQSVVLADGTFMIANKCPLPCSPANPEPKAALFDATNLTWKVLNSVKGYGGKFDENTEEGWTLLPNGDVLTIDTYVGVTSDPSGQNYETYNPTTEVWISGPPSGTSVQLWDSRQGCPSTASKHEIGPAVLRPDGTVFATGSSGCRGAAGHTAIYDTATGIWTPGFDIPGGNDMADVPAALLPSGNVLVDTGPRINKDPSTFYEYAFDGTGWVSIPQPIGLPSHPKIESGRMLVLPSGQILYTLGGETKGIPSMWFYTPGGTYQASWQPTIDPVYPLVVNVGDTYSLSGTQFNGLSQGAAYGDEAQSATNYPLVLITNNTTGNKFFTRTHNFSTMGVATQGEAVTTQFDVLSGTETGSSTMVVIANGIPSAAVDVFVIACGNCHPPPPGR